MFKNYTTFAGAVWMGLLLVACQPKLVINSESQLDREYQKNRFENAAMAVIFADSLVINYDRDDAAFPDQRYGYYLKRHLAGEIAYITVFQDVRYVYEPENAGTIRWESVNLSQENVTVEVPAPGTRIALAGDGFNYVLILGAIDIQHADKSVKERLSDVFDTGSQGITLHHLRYVLWDNDAGKAVLKGITCVETVELERYIGEQRWEQLIRDLAGQMFADTVFRK